MGDFRSNELEKIIAKEIDDLVRDEMNNNIHTYENYDLSTFSSIVSAEVSRCFLKRIKDRGLNIIRNDNV